MRPAKQYCMNVTAIWSSCHLLVSQAVLSFSEYSYHSYSLSPHNAAAHSFLPFVFIVLWLRKLFPAVFPMTMNLMFAELPSRKRYGEAVLSVWDHWFPKYVEAISTLFWSNNWRWIMVFTSHQPPKLLENLRNTCPNIVTNVILSFGCAWKKKCPLIVWMDKHLHEPPQQAIIQATKKWRRSCKKQQLV